MDTGGEDDYMSNHFVEAAQQLDASNPRPKKRNRVSAQLLSKKDIAAKEKLNRDVGLSTSIDPTNIGYQMLMKASARSRKLPPVVDATPSMANATPSMTNATPSMTNATPSVTDTTPSTTEATSPATNAAPSMTDVTPLATPVEGPTPIELVVKLDRSGIGNPSSSSSSSSSAKHTRKTPEPQLAVEVGHVETDAFRQQVSKRLEAKRYERHFAKVGQLVQDLDERQDIERHDLWPVEDAQAQQEDESVSYDRVAQVQRAVAYLQDQHGYCYWCGGFFLESRAHFQEPCPMRDDE